MAVKTERESAIISCLIHVVILNTLCPRKNVHRLILYNLNKRKWIFMVYGTQHPESSNFKNIYNFPSDLKLTYFALQLLLFFRVVEMMYFNTSLLFVNITFHEQDLIWLRMCICWTDSLDRWYGIVEFNVPLDTV